MEEEEDDDAQITITMHLRVASSTFVCLQLPSLEVGVDFGAIGDRLGLQPSSVRLNGHFISRDGRGMSTVTWSSMLSFFSSRGFPTGIKGVGDSILVQGRPVLEGSRCKISGASHEKVAEIFPSKRKLTLDDEKTLKKKKLDRCDLNTGSTCGISEAKDLLNFHLKRRCSADSQNFFKRKKTAHPDPNLEKDTSDFATDDSSILSLKRKLRLDDNNASNKRKTMEVKV